MRRSNGLTIAGRKLLLVGAVFVALMAPSLVWSDGSSGTPPIASTPQQAVANDSTIVEVGEASAASVAWDALLYATWTALVVL